MTDTVIKKPTFRQDWPSYNAAQINEKAKFQSLLKELLLGIPESNVKPKRGNQPLKVQDAIFAAVFKVYSTVSGRRFMSDLRDARAASTTPRATTPFSRCWSPRRQRQS